MGHLFHRMHRASQVPELAEVARDWYRQAFSMQRDGEGIAGFLVWDGVGWVEDTGLLMGAAGIGLAMLAAITDTAPEWDRLFLISGGPVR